MKTATNNNCAAMNPEVLVADGSLEIRGGFDDIFPNKKKVMCWAHAAKNMRLALDKHVKNKKINGNMFADLHKLQLAQSDKIFQKAARLVCLKYNEQISFVKYFKLEWLGKRCGWHEGVSHHCPSTNNAQEATHRAIKLIHTMRRLKSMLEMKKLLFDVVFEWSEVAANEPSSQARKLTSQDYIDAYIWNQNNVSIMRDPKDQEDDLYQTWFIPKDPSAEITDKMITDVKSLKWKTFDEFKVTNFQLYKVTTKLPSGMDAHNCSYCDCVTFFKDYKCVHSLGMAVRLGYVKISTKNKELAVAKIKSLIPIEKKNKRGRPKIAGKPLLVD